MKQKFANHYLVSLKNPSFRGSQVLHAVKTDFKNSEDIPLFVGQKGRKDDDLVCTSNWLFISRLIWFIDF